MNQQRKRKPRTLLRCGAPLLALLLLSGCASMLVRPVVTPLALSLEHQTDLKLIHDGAPSLLLLIDALSGSDPDNRALLTAGARAYTAYCAVLRDAGENERAAAMSLKAKQYGQAILRQFPAFASGLPADPAAFANGLACTGTGDVEALFWAGYAWASWINSQEGSPVAMIDLPLVEQIMLRVVTLDEGYYHGGAHIFLGIYYGSKPRLLGGRPDASRFHFERALELGDRSFFLAQVAYAETYARMQFDRELYVALLNEVLEAPEPPGGLEISNRLAQNRARRLLLDVDNYF